MLVNLVLNKTPRDLLRRLSALERCPLRVRVPLVAFDAAGRELARTTWLVRPPARPCRFTLRIVAEDAAGLADL